MRRRRMRYQPSKSQSIFSGVVGIIFCLIGLFVVIPTFGLFGLLWTGIAVFITIHNFAMASGKASMGSYVIEEEGAAPSSGEPTAEQRLQELRSLYDQRLITQEEYDQKRQEILDQI